MLKTVLGLMLEVVLEVLELVFMSAKAVEFVRM